MNKLTLEDIDKLDEEVPYKILVSIDENDTYTFMNLKTKEITKEQKYQS